MPYSVLYAIFNGFSILILMEHYMTDVVTRPLPAEQMS